MLLARDRTVLPDPEGHVPGRPADQVPDAVGGQPVAPRFRPGHHLVDARRAREDGVRLARRARIAAVVLEVEIQGASEVPVVGVEAVPDEGQTVDAEAGVGEDADRRERAALGVHPVVGGQDDEGVVRVIDVEEATEGRVVLGQVALHVGLVGGEGVLRVVGGGDVEEVGPLARRDLARHPEHPEVDLQGEDRGRRSGRGPVRLGMRLHVHAHVDPAAQELRQLLLGRDQGRRPAGRLEPLEEERLADEGHLLHEDLGARRPVVVEVRGETVALGKRARQQGDVVDVGQARQDAAPVEGRGARLHEGGEARLVSRLDVVGVEAVDQEHEDLRRPLHRPTPVAIPSSWSASANAATTPSMSVGVSVPMLETRKA